MGGISDSVVIACMGLGVPLVAGLSAWIATRQKREETLNERVDNRIRMLLDDRDKHVDSLKEEVRKLRGTIDSLIEVVRTVIVAGNNCPGARDGGCPIGKANIASKLSDVIASH